jgi:hypothetical protein
MPVDHKERAAKAQETALRKQHECEAEFGFKRRTFVRVVSAGSKQYLGRVGRLVSYNDLRDKDHPGISVEAAVVFSAGENQTPVFFEPKELEPAQQPANWGVSKAS